MVTKTELLERAEKKKIRRRRCVLLRCRQLYRPVKKNQRFCSEEHKNEYHFKTPTFQKFEDEIKGLIRKMVKPEALK